MSNDNIKVTVVTATYNLIQNGRIDLFRQCIESVYNQSYKNLEHIVVDGASTDGTLQVIKEYADKGWIRYISEADHGMCDAMNKGIKMATGEYVAILNSDDYYTQDALALSVAAIKKTNADYSYAVTNMLSRETGKIQSVWRCADENFCCFHLGIPFNHETMLCKRKVYAKLNYYEDHLYGTAADFYFVLKLILNDYKGVYIDKPILNFRLDGTTNSSGREKVSTTTLKHVKSFQDVYIYLWSQFLNSFEIRRIKKILKECKTEGINDKCLQYFCQDFRLKKYFKFLKSLKLKNFPYEKLAEYVNKNKIVTLKNSYYLFGFIKILSILSTEQHKVYKLFNILPVLSVKRKPNKMNYHFLGFVPFLTVKEK